MKTLINSFVHELALLLSGSSTWSISYGPGALSRLGSNFLGTKINMAKWIQVDFRVNLGKFRNSCFGLYMVKSFSCIKKVNINYWAWGFPLKYTQGSSKNYIWISTTGKRKRNKKKEKKFYHRPINLIFDFIKLLFTIHRKPIDTN